jgi:hypothetical protein
VLVISKEQVESLTHRLDEPTKLKQCRDEVEKMLEIKSTLLWRAEGLQPCCGSFGQIKTCLASEVQILEEVLDALDKHDIPRASSLLRDYTQYLGQLGQ